MTQLDQLLSHIAQMEMPYRVDVVDGVMGQIRAHAVRPIHRPLLVWRITSAVAVVVLAVGVWASVNIHNQRAMNRQLTMSLSSLNDYSYYQEECVIENIAEQALEPFSL